MRAQPSDPTPSAPSDPAPSVPSDPTPSAPSDPAPSVPSVPLPDAGPTDERPNRAARRGYREGTVPGAHGRGAAPHARGAQGRRVNPVRRTG